MKKSKKLEKILNHYGFENQREILVEECAELIQAVSKLKRNNQRISDNFIEELADVSIMIEQMKLSLCDKEKEKFKTFKREKILRQILRISDKPLNRNCTNCSVSDCSKRSGKEKYCGNYRPSKNLIKEGYNGIQK